MVAHLSCAVDVVPEGEECVGAEGHAAQLLHPRLPLLLRQLRRSLLQHALPRRGLHVLANRASCYNVAHIHNMAHTLIFTQKFFFKTMHLPISQFRS